MNVAFIPVRGGSKSIPLKNIKMCAGKPLVYWAVSAACTCPEIDAVFVSTDSKDIGALVSRFDMPKLSVIGRSAESATDEASTEFAMLEFAEHYDFENIVLIQATSPLIAAEDLSGGFALFGQNGVDSVLSVVEQKRFVWEKTQDDTVKPINYNPVDRPRRQDFEGFLVENGAFYITSRRALLNSRCRVSGNIKACKMSAESYIELDEPEDWIFVENLLRKKEKATVFRNIKMFISDCDGTLTDGGMYYSSTGEAMKKFNTRDGMGLRLLKENGIITAIVTSETTESVRKRAEKTGVDELIMGVSDKRSAIAALCEKYHIDISEVAYIGDDLNDLDVIRSVGFGICVNDAVSQVKSAADFVTNLKGGKGAVREAADLIIAGTNYDK